MRLFLAAGHIGVLICLCFSPMLPSRQRRLSTAIVGVDLHIVVAGSSNNHQQKYLQESEHDRSIRSGTLVVVKRRASLGLVLLENRYLDWKLRVQRVSGEVGCFDD